MKIKTLLTITVALMPLMVIIACNRGNGGTAPAAAAQGETAQGAAPEANTAAAQETTPQETTPQEITLPETVFEFGKITYVNSIEGLRMRSEPSNNGEVIRTLSYGEVFVIGDKSNQPVTIDGITDYWYKMMGYEGWVFGGYLSENLPANVPVILGYWEIEDNNAIMYYFDKNLSYRIGQKESEWFDIGTWELSGKVLTFTQLSGAYEELETPEITISEFSIIDNNHITLQFANGMETKLVRSKSIY